jgi:hypothetical protein
MQDTFLKILDIFFFGFHTVLILFNVFGWIIPKWRLLNIILLSLTAFSWFALGIWYGWGYCICTDWHWQVREMLGFHDMSSSYIHFLILKLANLDLSISPVNKGTVIVFFTAYIISAYLNIRKYMHKQ